MECDVLCRRSLLSQQRKTPRRFLIGFLLAVVEEDRQVAAKAEKTPASIEVPGLCYSLIFSPSSFFRALKDFFTSSAAPTYLVQITNYCARDFPSHKL